MQLENKMLLDNEKKLLQDKLNFIQINIKSISNLLNNKLSMTEQTKLDDNPIKYKTKNSDNHEMKKSTNTIVFDEYNKDITYKINVSDYIYFMNLTKNKQTKLINNMVNWMIQNNLDPEDEGLMESKSVEDNYLLVYELLTDNPKQYFQNVKNIIFDRYINL